MAKLALALLVLFSPVTHAAQPVLSSFELADVDPAKLRTIGKLFEIEHARNGRFEVQVPAEQADLLRSLAPGARLLEADVSGAIRAKLRKFALTSAAGYHSFDQVQSWMKGLSAGRPDLARVIDYGTSAQNRKLTALHLASARSLGKPTVMITAATHGDELITTEVLMHLVDRLVAAYGKEDRLTRLVDEHDLYFIPVVNPDGFAGTNRYDGFADPNRSYPYPQHENARPTPSIAGVMKLFAGLDLKASIDFHAFGELIMYPWAYTHAPVDANAHARFDTLTKHMAEANRYTYGPIADVIYVAPGSSADYYFWKKGSLSLGIEMGNDKVPDPSEFPAYFESQEESTWRFLEGV